MIIEKGVTDNGSPDIYTFIKITAYLPGEAVIFLSWRHAFHDYNQDHNIRYTVITLRLSLQSLA